MTSPVLARLGITETSTFRDVRDALDRMSADADEPVSLMYSKPLPQPLEQRGRSRRSFVCGFFDWHHYEPFHRHGFRSLARPTWVGDVYAPTVPDLVAPDLSNAPEKLREELLRQRAAIEPYVEAMRATDLVSETQYGLPSRRAWRKVVPVLEYLRALDVVDRLYLMPTHLARQAVQPLELTWRD